MVGDYGEAWHPLEVESGLLHSEEYGQAFKLNDGIPALGRGQAAASAAHEARAVLGVTLQEHVAEPLCLGSVRVELRGEGPVERADEKVAGEAALGLLKGLLVIMSPGKSLVLEEKLPERVSNVGQIRDEYAQLVCQTQE